MDASENKLFRRVLSALMKATSAHQEYGSRDPFLNIRIEEWSQAIRDAREELVKANRACPFCKGQSEEIRSKCTHNPFDMVESPCVFSLGWEGCNCPACLERRKVHESD